MCQKSVIRPNSKSVEGWCGLQKDALWSEKLGRGGQIIAGGNTQDCRRAVRDRLKPVGQAVGFYERIDRGRGGGSVRAQV